MKTIDSQKLLEEYERMTEEERRNHPEHEYLALLLEQKENPLTEEERETARRMVEKHTSTHVNPSDD